MTPNSEMIVEAQKHPEFLHVVQSTSLNLPDSIGVKWMARLKGQYIPERVTGVDTVTKLCAELRDTRVFLLGAAEGVAESARDTLVRANPHLNIVGTYAGSPSEDDEEHIIDLINAANPQILFVAFGSPAQDLWIARNLQKMSSVNVAMGVGGTLDFLAVSQVRAPGVMQRLGLEWLWRLCKQPQRLPRIVRAVVVFPYLVLRGS